MSQAIKRRAEWWRPPLTVFSLKNHQPGNLVPGNQAEELRAAQLFWTLYSYSTITATAAEDQDRQAEWKTCSSYEQPSLYQPCNSTLSKTSPVGPGGPRSRLHPNQKGTTSRPD